MFYKIVMCFDHLTFFTESLFFLAFVFFSLQTNIKLVQEEEEEEVKLNINRK